MQPDDSIGSYAGPYERWVFSDDLGRPFAFPAIAGKPSGYYTALLEGGHIPDLDPDLTVRVPPLWNPSGQPLAFIPFAFHQATDGTGSYDPDIDQMLQRLHCACSKDPDRPGPRFRINFPVAVPAWTADYQEGGAPANWTPPATPPKAIIAVIDDGIPFANRAFLDSTGKTRVSHCWLQSARAPAQAHVPFGREYVNDEIDTLRTTVGSDDVQLYREAGAVDSLLDELGTHLRRHATHGAHIMGLAAGNDTLFPDHGIGEDVQIIAVQLPNTIAWDTSGFGKEMYMLSALHYVFDRARRIAEHFECDELPLVVNFSYGWSASRHDGQSEMALAIQALLQQRQALQPLTALTMPMGNNFDQDMHAAISEDLFESDAFALGWHLQPDDLTSSYLELWFPEGFDPAEYTITMIPPHGMALDTPGTIPVTPDPNVCGDPDGDPRRFVELVMNGANIGQLSADQHRGNRWRVMVAMIPTAYTRGQTRRAPVGRWTLQITRAGSATPLPSDKNIHIWLQRDDDPSDLKTNGRQSRLVDLADPPRPPKPPLQDFAEGLGLIEGFGGMNGVATAPLTTRVSGYVQSNKRPSRYSGGGGVRQADGSTMPWGVQPDIAAVADHSRALPGLTSIGVLSGSRGRYVGTSCASPSAARLMVLNAAAGLPLLDGLGAALPLYHTESPTPGIGVQLAARTGPKTAPPIVKMG